MSERSPDARLRVARRDFIAETSIYCRLQARGVTVEVVDEVGHVSMTLVPSTPLPCDDCEDGSGHAECRWVRGLVLELERVTAERDALLAVRE